MKMRLEIAASSDDFGQVESRDGIARLRLHGPLTAATSPRVRELIRERTAAGETLVVDLEAVTAIDAAGVAALLEGQRRAREHEGNMVLQPNHVVRRALKESGTISVFQLWTGSTM